MELLPLFSLEIMYLYMQVSKAEVIFTFGGFGQSYNMYGALDLPQSSTI